MSQLQTWFWCNGPEYIRPVYTGIHGIVSSTAWLISVHDKNLIQKQYKYLSARVGTITFERQGCKLWRVAQLQYSQSFRFWQLISGELFTVSDLRSVVMMLPLVQRWSVRIEIPIHLQAWLFRALLATASRTREIILCRSRERGQSSSLLSQRALNFSLNISRAAASAELYLCA